MNNSLSPPGSQLEDEAFFMFYSNDNEEEINEQMGLTDREFFFFG